MHHHLHAEPRGALEDVPRPRVLSFSWSNQGNIGDDWLGSTVAQHFDATTVVERRRWLAGQHRLDARRADRQLPLLLWGGGWLAGDQARNNALDRWSRHLARRTSPTFGIGLGIGPFGDSVKAARVLSQLSVVVARTQEDCRTASEYTDALLGCDTALLERSVEPQSDPANSLELTPYTVVGLPAYRSHWVRFKPWLTEQRYLATVHRVLKLIPSPPMWVTFDRTEARRDARYWEARGKTITDLKSVAAARSLIGGADATVAGRLRCALMSAALGRPTIALSYHHKFDAARELGVPVLLGEEDEWSSLDFRVASASALDTVRTLGLHALNVVRERSPE